MFSSSLPFAFSSCFASDSQSLLEQAVFGFFLVLFVVAVAMNFAGSNSRLRPARAESPGPSRLAPAPPPSGRTWQSLWDRCRWEFDILKEYLVETKSFIESPLPKARPQPSVRQAPAGEERRRWTRHPSSLQAVCWLPGKKNQGTWSAAVRDISVGGVGLVSPRSFPLGTVLEFQLLSNRFVDQTPLQAEVMFMTRNSRRDWVLGCEFLMDLTPGQVEAYL